MIVEVLRVPIPGFISFLPSSPEESFRLDLLHALANEVSPCGKKLRAICFNVRCFPQTKALSRVSGGGVGTMGAVQW